jgi:hypothetical protein
MAAQAQLQQMRRPGLPPGMSDPGAEKAAARPGTYL